MRSPNLLLHDIIDAANEIKSYIENISQPEFVQDSMRYNATIRMIAIIGEAISKLEKDYKTQYPDIPWNQIIGMRNNIIHEYWQTDLDQIYTTAIEDVPKLTQLILPILDDLESKNETSSQQ